MSHQISLQSIIDAMPDHVAVIADDGAIVCVNEAWRQFASGNDGDAKHFYVGQNYFWICDESAAHGDEIAARIAAGLRHVLLAGEEFSAEYPCHRPSELRWFKLMARPLDIEGRRFALVAHRNVTTENSYLSQVSQARQEVTNFAAIIETMPDAMIALDMAGHITNWNAAAQKLYGYTPDEAIGCTMEILYPPDSPKRIKDYVVDIVVNGLRHFEAIRVTKAGQARTIEISAALIRSASGSVIGVSNIHRDVTEQREADARLRGVINNLFAFVGVLSPDGTLLEANRAPLEVAGLSEDEVVGKKFWDCYWWSYSPDIQKQLEQSCKKACAGEVVRYDVEIRVAGERLLWIDFQVAPLFSSAGEVINLIPSGTDISDRRAAAEALSVSRDSFRNIVERSPFGVYTVNSDFRLAHVSTGAQKAFANVHPLIGHDFADALHTLWPEAFASEAISRFRHTLATGEPYRSRRMLEHRLDIGEVEAYDWMIERIDLPDGRPGVVCHFYDLSERARYEDHIRMLMGEVNHRAKNLLTVVISMARQTARDVSPEDFVRQYSQRLLGLSASQDLIVQGNWRGVTVRDLVRSQLNHLGENLIDKRVSLIGPDMTITPAAAQGIGMALHELSTNALKYGSLSTRSGEICIKWETTVSKFKVRWQEVGGPAVKTPQSSGFGRTVIEKMAAKSVDGRVELDYSETGLNWTLTAPISNIESGANAQKSERGEAL